MPANSSKFQCPKSKTTFCISAQGCRVGKEITNPALCPLEAAPEAQHNRPATKAARTMLKRRLAITHETKPHQQIYITRAEWVRIKRSNKEV